MNGEGTGKGGRKGRGGARGSGSAGGGGRARARSRKAGRGDAGRPRHRRRFLRRLLVAWLVSALAALAASAWAWQRWVVDDPGVRFSREHILQVIAQESPVYYRDGRTPLGVFFSREHRVYVSYDEIPKAWIDAIVAAEDERFFSHHGVDPRGIARAMWLNLRAGRVVAGGSTITQQTAKNLFYRPDRSLRSKLRELLDALRLEAHYSKEEILEFYANQFHVSGNGRGLGIAARYFFDKDVSELDTLECAFLAGMVKGPARYDPFVGETEEERAVARRRARERTRYVLDRMLETGRLSREEHDRLVARDIPFRKGTFRFGSSAALDEVARRLARPPFPGLFEDLGIDNPSTAGIRIVTTLDVDAQREARYALVHHLAEVGVVLEGLDADALRPEGRVPPHRERPLPVHGLAPARVVAVAEDGVELDLGGDRRCTVDREGIDRLARAVASHRLGRWTRRPEDADRAAVRALLAPGALVRASLRAPGLCDLEPRPELQGGVMLVEDGAVRAMVGGFDDRGFNRAVAARRQLGSTWKPLVFAAALQLGWSPLDRLDNRENVFPFEGTWYAPRPDHHSAPFVSLAWAGTRSENPATIWLLAHLVDRLDPEAFRAVARASGLDPEADDRAAWISLVRDRYGVISTRDRTDEVAFVAARLELARELPEDEALELRTLIYGRGAEEEAARVRREERGERRDRLLRALRANLLHLRDLAATCEAQASALADLAEAGRRAAHPSPLAWLGLAERPAPPEVPDPAAFDRLRVRPWEGRLALACGDADEAWRPVDAELLGRLAEGSAPEPGPVDEMWLDGRLRLSTLRELERRARRRALVLGQADPYDIEFLQYHPDFRTLVSLRAVARLAHSLGVREDLPPVLSLPLGAVEISLEEAAVLYEGLADGEVHTFPGLRFTSGGVAGLRTARPVAAVDAPTLLVAEVRDAEGNVLYRAEPRAERVVSAAAGRELGDILRNVVRWGTGRRARAAVLLGGRPVPLAGKTGTTNGFRNAAFVGLVPRASGGRWRWGEGWTLAIYVGYDDNRSMRRGGVRLAGASGALPAWIGVARGLADRGLLGDAPPADDEFAVEEGYARVAVDPAGGLPTGAVLADDAPSVLFEGTVEEGRPRPERRLGPLWEAPPPRDLSPTRPEEGIVPRIAPDP